MAFRLTLLCCAGTRSARDGGFPDPDEPVDEASSRRAGDFRLAGPEPTSIACSPARAARQTIDLIQLTGEIEPALSDIDHGIWRGRSFEDVQLTDPEAFSAWLASPETGAPGGESLQAVQNRIANWLANAMPDRGHVVAITHPMIVRAILCETLAMPPTVAQRIDIAPLATVALSWNRSWRLQELTRG